MARTPLAVMLAVGVLLTAGCGGDATTRNASDGDRDRDRDRQRPQVEKKQRPAPERKIVAPKPAPKKSRNALTIEPGGAERDADAHLIGARALGDRWSVRSTGGEDGRMTSDCQRATLRDIGAEETRIRDFSADGSVAVQAVSRFVDPKSAWRAEQVVVAWREDCADDLRQRDAALGTVRHGVWVSVVEVAGVTAPKRQMRAAIDAVESTF